MIQKRCITAIFILLLSSCQGKAQCGKVIDVHDGDTFVLLTEGNKKIKVRIAFIDCPELKQEFGPQAQAFTRKEIYHQNVCLDIKYYDPYKRAVAVVTIPDGRILNEELLKKGYAWHFSKYSGDAKLAGLEGEARKKKSGIWKNPSPVPPWEWRKSRHTGYRKK